MKYLWIYLTFLATLLTGLRVFLVNLTSKSYFNNDYLLIGSIVYIIAGIFGLIYCLTNYNYSINVISNFDKNFLLLIIATGFMHYLTSVIVFKTLKITPNLTYSHTIINTNILITLLLSYCFFKESFNMLTLTGIFLILIGVILIINYH